jgi:hypothetical protein
MPKHKDNIPGGYADKRQPRNFPKDQMKMGRKVEYEHTNDPKIADEISMDHLEEIPDYYDRLEDMEDKAKKEGQLRNVEESLGDKVDRFLELLTEAYCPACGGHDKKEALTGRGHAQGCPIGDPYTSIETIQQKLPPVADKIFKNIRLAMADISELTRSLFDMQKLQDKPSVMNIPVADSIKGWFSNIDDAILLLDLPPIHMRFKDTQRLYNQALTHADHGDHDIAAEELYEVLERLENLRRLVQLAKDI